LSDIRHITSEIRQQGHIEFDAYLAPGMWAAAAPVLDSQEQLVAALTIVGPADDPKDHRRASINALLAAARDASERLGAFTRKPASSSPPQP
jgi:DNA-binding IclR family transcriptional regulator